MGGLSFKKKISLNSPSASKSGQKYTKLALSSISRITAIYTGQKNPPPSAFLTNTHYYWCSNSQYELSGSDSRVTNLYIINNYLIIKKNKKRNSCCHILNHQAAAAVLTYTRYHRAVWVIRSSSSVSKIEGPTRLLQ